MKSLSKIFVVCSFLSVENWKMTSMIEKQQQFLAAGRRQPMKFIQKLKLYMVTIQLWLEFRQGIEPTKELARSCTRCRISSFIDEFHFHYEHEFECQSMQRKHSQSSKTKKYRIGPYVCPNKRMVVNFGN